MEVFNMMFSTLAESIILVFYLFIYILPINWISAWKSWSTHYLTIYCLWLTCPVIMMTTSSKSSLMSS